MKRFTTIRRLCGLLWLSLALGNAPLLVHADAPLGEYQVKAAFLLNFARFAEWPDSAFSDTNSPFVIGVVGVDPFGASLDDVVRGESVHGHPILVKRFQADDDLSGCHAVFLTRSTRDKLDLLLRELRGRPVLTVSDTDGLAVRGVMLNLLLVEGSVKRIEVNLKASAAGGIQFSSKLLSLARIVDSDAPRSKEVK